MDLKEGIQQIFERLENQKLLDFLVSIHGSQTHENFAEIVNVQLLYDTPLDFNIIRQDVKKEEWYKRVVAEISNAIAFLRFNYGLSKTQRRKINKYSSGLNNNKQIFLERVRKAIESVEPYLNKLKFKKYYFVSAQDEFQEKEVEKEVKQTINKKYGFIRGS